MQRSNTYIILFSALLTIVLGGMLSFASVGLKPMQEKQIDLDTKKKILSSVMDISNIRDPNELLALYDARMKSTVVDINGNLVEADAKGNPVVAEKVNIQKQFRIKPEERLYPVFMLKNDTDTTKIDAYVFPMFGSGLWDWISGYIALESDLNTIAGVSFDHKTETPGLGARITSPIVQGRYVGKEIYNNEGELISVTMVKGEGNDGLNEHQVDGLSGATMTAKGVNIMLERYFEFYQSYISKVKSGSQMALNQ